MPTTERLNSMEKKKSNNDSFRLTSDFLKAYGT